MSPRGPLLAAALLAVALALPAPAAAGEPATRYAPVPPDAAALVGTPAEEALAARAIASIEAADADAAFAARAELLCAGDAGLRKIAERLAERPVSPAGLLVALEVASASRVRGVDALLERAAGEERFEARALAARGLARGRTGAAVPALARLARDPAPVVRGAAVRGLFAIEEPAAKAARAALPPDADPRVAALRLRLHRLRDDVDEAIGRLAWRAYVEAPSPEERLEAARCLARPGAAATERALATVVYETGGGPAGAAFVRGMLRVPLSGYDPATMRTTAAEALLAWVSRPDLPAARRAALVDLAVSWVAKPTRVRGRSVDEEARLLLSSALPDLGEAMVEPVSRRLLADGFDDPWWGVRLLASLSPDLAVASLTALLEPSRGASRALVGAVSGALRDLGHAGGADVAALLLAKSQAADVRTDAILALRGEPGEVALPLLEAALLGDDDALASTAAGALLERREPRARELLLASLLDARLRPHEPRFLQRLARRPDEALWTGLDRAMRAGPVDLRRWIFDAIRTPQSGLRGPRAVALVRLPMAAPDLLGLDPVKVMGALSAVDGPASVAYLRARLSRTPPDSVDARRVMLRDLGAVAEPAARELALEVAAATPDSDEGMLGEVVHVLRGRTEKDAARTDPFWRRLLKTTGLVRVAALDALARSDESGRPEIPRGDLSALLVPIVANDLEPEETRLRALDALVLGPFSGAEDFLFGLATSAREPDDLRERSAKALVGTARPATRAKALAWLREPCLENAEVVVEIGRLAGSGAGPAEAAEALRLLETTIAARDRSQPLVRSGPAADATDTYATRISALVAAVAATGDAPSLGALAGHLFDPRFAGPSALAIRHEKSTWSGGDDVLAPLGDPPTLEALAHESERSGRHTPTSPLSREVAPLVRGLKSAGAGDDAHAAAVAAVVGRAVAGARARGDLAAFHDLWLVGIAKQLRQRGREEPPGDFSAAAEAVEDALEATWPAGGPEEWRARQVRADAHVRAGRWARAADELEEAARLGAATGLADLPSAVWLDRSPAPPPSWRRLRALADLLRGAAAASEGRPEEARAHLRRGLARDPYDAATLRDAARLRVRTGFDLDAAEADARRALALDRRQGEARSPDQDRTIAEVLAAKAGTAAEKPEREDAGDD